MVIARHELTAPRERIIQGTNGWWFVGPGGVARLSSRQVSDDSRLVPEAERDLRAKGLFRQTVIRTYSLTVLTSTDCNLGCGYCFQNTAVDSTGGSRPPRIDHARLTSTTITDILEFTRRQMDLVGLDRMVLMLFGGEPLLNPRGAKELLRRAAGCGMVCATMTSNGTLLTPILAGELHDLGLRDVQVTFDGDRPDHDRIRVTRGGGATFDTIVHNMASVSEAVPINWCVRINVSHHNVDGVGALIERLAEQPDPARISIHLARVGDIGVGYANELLTTDDLAATFARWQRRALDLGFAVPRPRPDAPCYACSYRDGRYGAVVSADGTLASCWETAGRPEWMVGTVTGGYLPADRTGERWTSCGTGYQENNDPIAVRRFEDLVDAQLLDYLNATGRLAASATP